MIFIMILWTNLIYIGNECFFVTIFCLICGFICLHLYDPLFASKMSTISVKIGREQGLQVRIFSHDSKLTTFSHLFYRITRISAPTGPYSS